MVMAMNIELKVAIVRKFGNQGNFARAAKVDEPTVSRVIRSRKQLPEDEKARWAGLLGCEVKEIWN
jgi:hypothetical protein